MELVGRNIPKGTIAKIIILKGVLGKFYMYIIQVRQVRNSMSITFDKIIVNI